jgi:Concanavalin A-like lectin/glucanases superfamily/Bacterial Ig-like domain (group 2)
MVLANKISRLYLFCLIGLLLASSASAAGKKLISITVTPSVLNAAIGKTQQFKATGYFSDGSAQDLTSSVVWNSSSPAVAVITSSGLATVQAAGNTTITASIGARTTITSQAGTSQPPPSGLPSGLALHWTLDTTAITDISGNGSNGVVNGSLTVVAGKFGQALRFNGASYIAAPSVSAASFSHSLSLSAWINTTNTSRTEAIFSKYEAAGSEAGYIFATNPNGNLVLRIGGTNMAGGPHSATDTTKINDGQWHHVIAVISYESQTITFYVDGKPTSTTAMQMVPNDGGATLQVGQNPYTPYGDYFTGSIDEVQLYSRALTASEASTVYLLSGGL